MWLDSKVKRSEIVNKITIDVVLYKTIELCTRFFPEIIIFYIKATNLIFLYQM